MISLDKLWKTYEEGEVKTDALRGVSCKIKKGEFVSIMGPSGSGKSTLLHILSFLDRPTGGQYTFSGRKMSDLSDIELARIRNKEMGFVFQAFNLLGTSTVYENIELPLLYSDMDISKRQSVIEKAVAAVGLSEKINTTAGRLSGGQKQRVAIARALVNDPDIIFADEPTGNLDSHSGVQVMEILEVLNNNGKTIILVTHETYTAEFGRRLIRLKDGEIEVDEPIRERHQHAGLLK
ncbi:MAG: macrolide ABC transporter ATP-binding protein [Candidatus Taylorbacteria bacterium RIFCSPHIGHO2_01_FULL_45_63]|uniref:Macrolide ABC transporter ATP-binding protein n=1 Tax=Candidatus Taylorbacteria bacterium RIFCSPHIGHO2_02_FULL_45_35 TaxID=1802311 RepID=A0A1G2MPI3_9BACT|nr:MAG: macrolide ABC transporter ATP-binding protein [Candidatus Taylorbacteria bacterium RIFCSPHIGHO2_01_FULL_45_63]OHA25807.1 MAG: macrolide ABC transporter ATP-binding protein [Candidatus Taylorbacteria bacterium RIFCSPHIGHO2_02_FULL_45_35]OHA34360.1 MAG: macrolide ABC transporter ATP-binding protein [Candidatus Taylorbacteria bacterium RIFCSPLOWO2_01_FULL_45_34b]